MILTTSVLPPYPAIRQREEKILWVREIMENFRTIYIDCFQVIDRYVTILTLGFCVSQSLSRLQGPLN